MAITIIVNVWSNQLPSNQNIDHSLMVDTSRSKFLDKTLLPEKIQADLDDTGEANNAIIRELLADTQAFEIALAGIRKVEAENMGIRKKRENGKINDTTSH
mgnify:CR=1 FL=1